MDLAGRLIGLPLALLVAAGTSAPAFSGSPDAVTRERIDLIGTDEPHTPSSLNQTSAFRYINPEMPAPATVLVLIPGLNSGVNTMDLLARALVASPGPALEVWVVMQRASFLQDRTGIEAALDHRNPDFALGYYYGGLAIDGRVFRPIRDVSSGAYWGLDLHLRDIRAVVHEAHRRFPRAKVVLGGHSLGGILAALYAGYDFGRTPGPHPVPLLNGIPAPSAEAGARDLSGLLLLDGVPLNLFRRLTASHYLDGFQIPTVGHIPGIDELTTTDPGRRVGPFTDLPGLARTQDSILFDVIAVYAYLRPNEPSHLPFYPRNGLAITNEALLGAILSSDMQPDLFVRASIGVPLGIFRRMPDPAGVNPLGLFDLQSGSPAPREALIRWIPYDQRTPRPRVDLRALEEAILRPGADFTQWYMPWRLFLDLGLAAELDTGDEFARQFVSLTQVRHTALPLLIIGAGKGLVRDARSTLFYRDHIATPPEAVGVEILDGFTHLDVENAAANPAVPRIRAWLEAVVH